LNKSNEFKVDDQGVDVLTKALAKSRFGILKDKPGLCSNQGKEEICINFLSIP